MSSSMSDDAKGVLGGVGGFIVLGILVKLIYELNKSTPAPPREQYNMVEMANRSYVPPILGAVAIAETVTGRTINPATGRPRFPI